MAIDPRDTTPEYRAASGDIGTYPHSGPESKEAGYETTDVNVGGVAVFLGGLFGFVLIFFVFCFLMGKVINSGLNKADGPADKWHQGQAVNAGGSSQAMDKNGPKPKREDLKNNTAMEQQELQHLTSVFPSPRLDIDDGNQATADLHAREDLLLDHYSSTPGQPGVRIPIDQAMQLIAQRGLPISPAGQTLQNPSPLFAGSDKALITRPLTSGFARTGYELDTIEARQQKLNYGKAEANQHAELRPVH